MTEPKKRRVIPLTTSLFGRQVIITGLLIAGLLFGITGCPWKDKDSESADELQSQETSLEGISLKVLVVEDDGLATAVEQACGEWQAQTGSRFTLAQTTEQDLHDAEPLDADVLICPSYMVGDLAERDLIVPLSETDASQNDEDWQDVFVLERRREAVWGDAVVGVPFGSPVLICYCRSDLLQHFNVEPPQTWSEYQRLVELFSHRDQLGDAAPPADQPWNAAIEPLGPGWAGLTLLARAAPLAKHSDNYSTLFDIKTMRPLIDGPPFVRALEDLAEAAHLNQNVGLSHDPHSARRAFWRGQCGLAVTWPTAADKDVNTAIDNKPAFSCTPVELPGSLQVYNIDEARWTTREKDEETRVPLLAVSGRMGTISRGSSHPKAAAALLFWLSGRELKPPLGTRSTQTTLYRKSQLQFPLQWVEAEMSLNSALLYGDVAERAFDRADWLFALRIPGRQEYLAALDKAVRQAVAEGKSPQKALRETAAHWRDITQRHDKARQLRAYRKSLELRP